MIEDVESLHEQRAGQWLCRLRGDPYAALLCADGSVQAAGWAKARSFAGAAPRRSALGPLVVAGYDMSRAVLEALPAEALPPDRAAHTDGAWFDRVAAAAEAPIAAAQEHSDRLAATYIAGARLRADLVELTVRTAAAVIAEGFGLSTAQRDRLALVVPAAAAAVDALFCPQRLSDHRAASDALAAVRAVGQQTRSPAADLLVLLTAAGAPAAAGLVVHTVRTVFGTTGEVEGVADDSERTRRIVDEVRRLHPPVRLWEGTLPRALRTPGASIAAGERVAVVIAAANRDPSVYPEPDRFDPCGPGRTREAALPLGPYDRVLAPFAHTCAEAVVRGLARRAATRGARGASRDSRPPSVVYAARAAVTGRIARFPAVVLDGPPGRWPAGRAAHEHAEVAQ
ncbi:cytochrome P450 [Thermobifida alba]|uniref:Cytochrome P450 n=1 Tax=Thermobifida alba TaxID=53522 RepID=A0ABY4L3B3_THEAE|nr:cytochrome P450 [Thermobifida alba]UPT20808.1 cytochrome P450 [Thermobifida alba]